MRMNKLSILLFFVLFLSTSVLTGCAKGGKSYDNGVKAYKEEDYEKAASEFAQAMGLNPDRGIILLHANTLLLLENYEQAINVYNQVITEKIVRLLGKIIKELIMVRELHIIIPMTLIKQLANLI